MTIETIKIGDICAENKAMIFPNAVLLVYPKKKAGHNRQYPTFNFIVNKAIKRHGRVYVLGTHVPTARLMSLDQETRVKKPEITGSTTFI